MKKVNNAKDLLPCPFCGCPEIEMKWMHTSASEIFIEYKIKCKGCLANMFFERLASLPPYPAVRNMINDWNNRTNFNESKNESHT